MKLKLILESLNKSEIEKLVIGLFPEYKGTPGARFIQITTAEDEKLQFYTVVISHTKNRPDVVIDLCQSPRSFEEDDKVLKRVKKPFNTIQELSDILIDFKKQSNV